MELGAKILQARQEAGLSQRQLCGDVITRNMLSQIEHGTAQPSMATLRYLAQRLGKSISFFLEEDSGGTPNHRVIRQAWELFENKENDGCAKMLEAFVLPDEILEREWKLLSLLNLLASAEAALEQNRNVYARELLERCESLECALPWLPELRHRRVLLLGKLEERLPESLLPDVDAELMLLSRHALKEGDPEEAARFLEACRNQKLPEWNYLRGRTAMAKREYGTAAKCFQNAETALAGRVIPLLEICFREMGDYKMAYYYACKFRDI